MSSEQGPSIDIFKAAVSVVRQVYVDAYRQGWRPDEPGRINIGAELATVLETFPPEIVERLTQIENGNEQTRLAKIRDEIMQDIRSGALEIELAEG